jgi:hypothetical protein
MIFKIAALQKLMEKAYKNGLLIIGREEYTENGHMGYYISNGQTWIVWNDENLMPNCMKAAIVNYLGFLPEYGQEYDIEKSQKGQAQSRIPDQKYNLRKRFGLSHSWARWEITPLRIDRGEGDFTILQASEEVNGICREIRTELLGMVKPDEIMEKEGEAYVGGPLIADGSGALWASNVCYVLLQTYVADSDERLLKHIQQIRINSKE